MINWKDLQVIFLLAFLMLGCLGAAVFVQFQDQAEQSFSLLPAKPQSPRVNGAISIERPVANPILRIDQPAVSVFSPAA